MPNDKSENQQNLFLNKILLGNSLEILQQLPLESVDLVFADPPYNLQLNQDLWRPNMTKVDAVDDDWDQFESMKAYDQFTVDWLQATRKVMKDDATIWISGTYHNIFRVGNILQNLGFWILNTVTWFKPNAMPNFRGTRLKNDVEYVIWAKKSEESQYTFNHHVVKQFNDFSDGKQLGSVWKINVCGGEERLKDVDGNKLHSTQKPEELLKRIIIASSQPDDVVLDPFSGTGTTVAVAKWLRRQWIGVEQDDSYYQASLQRLDKIQPIAEQDPLIQATIQETPPRVAFQTLIEMGYLNIGQLLYLDDFQATILENGKLQVNGSQGSIHRLGAKLKNVPSCNGWKHWYFEDDEGELHLIDKLREQYRKEHL